ncbi:MAG TPA: DUF1353 domain-containing protein [Marmoricola sp.]|nr:DUF1353 domain-containing protein [Marmoricola sp.]
MALHLTGQPGRFHDGGTSDEPPDPDSPPTIVLERTLTMPVDRFRMLRRIGYRDRVFGELLVPADPARFVTDLTSVPSVFGWLVPRTGRHLPAALLHDGLVSGPGQPPAYLSTEGADLDRVAANRVFRDAMADTGTGLVRRWLMWTAVTTATAISGQGTHWSAAVRWRHRLTALGTIVVVAVLGALATLDLFDLHVAGLPGVPWMGSRSWVVELLSGAAGAVVIPLLLGLLWGRSWIAGVVLGVGLALLLHVTVVILVLTALYQAVEWLATRHPALALGLAGLVVAVSAAGFLIALA